VSKDRIYHSLSAVFGHKSQVFWVSWLPADEIDFSALLFFSRAFFILHFGVDKCLWIWYDIDGLEISVAHPVQRIINVRHVIYCRLSAVSDISRYFLQRRLLPADRIDILALLFSAGLFILHFAIDKCLRIWYDIGGLEISVAHPVQRTINVRHIINCRLSAVSDISRYFLQR